MCGIVGYVGRRPGKPIILDGLRRLEYRGYDSAGLTLLEAGGLETVRAVGNLDALFAAVGDGASPATVGLGHTRWATHGSVRVENAHPHADCTGRISVVLNGIIENYKELRAALTARGHRLTSETDAEVVVHLVEEHAGEGLAAAVRAAIPRLEGHFAFCAVSADEPDLVVGTRREAPLVVGVGEDEMFFASAIPAFLSHTREVIVLEDGDVVTLRASGAECTDVAGVSVERAVSVVPWDQDAAEKAGYDTFMLKEINEQPAALRDTLAGRLSEAGDVDLAETGMGDEMLRRLRRIFIVACGTSYHAGLIVSYAIEQLARVPVQIDVASEFRYREPVFDPDTLVIGITQSGETADTLAAMRLARAAGSPVLALCNIMGSQATREADHVLFTRAGLEIGVAATKTHTAQVAALLLLALRLAWARGVQPEAELRRLGHELRAVPEKLEELLARPSAVEEIAARYRDERFFLYLGRGMGFAVCLEGALKLKEISYIPTEAYAAGEMKHGPIALLDKESPVVVVADDSPVFPKLVSNVEEVRARGADVIAVATDGNETIRELSRDVLWVPRTDHHLAPILTVVPLQLLAYHIATLKGYNVDQPRNLAKTVTVE
ncbi:MAG: glutamine--fructose-6-phosphate transaminase (isomerizing) [Thermoleophilia bacterium]|nr:glutamine--fructose-6-phosphate transaminase (isomerizing) [Thermoleophilia bacterium]